MDTRRGKESAWPLPDIVLPRGFCARIDHPFIAFATCIAHTVAILYATLLRNSRLPFRPPGFMPYIIQYWAWQYRVKAKSQLGTERDKHAPRAPPPIPDARGGKDRQTNTTHTDRQPEAQRRTSARSLAHQGSGGWNTLVVKAPLPMTAIARGHFADSNDWIRLYLDAEVLVLPPPVLCSGLVLLAAELRRHGIPLPALLSNSAKRS